MSFAYCPYCGEKLTPKEIGDEGMLPYCNRCLKPFWEEFSVCVICAVVNEHNQVALLKQSYVSQQNEVCVAGFIQKGETAEQTAIREIEEEIGLDVQNLTYIKSYFHEKKNMLMFGFRADVKKADFTLSKEVDSARWVNLKNAPEYLKKGGIAWQLVSEIKGKYNECKRELFTSHSV